MNSQGALAQYQEVGVRGGVADATPHRLIQMLLEGALDKISTARGHMLRGEITAKGRHISWAISIIDGLRGSLDMEAGGEIADNLEALYTYMKERLLQANVRNEPELLDEVAGLLSTIKEGWDGIPQEFRNASREELDQMLAGG
ncbi:MAG TPA: flagellar export chaperone FliS [Thiotrichales bacterium]|nr:flagellar export chaperone FliS [Thiotrichales bacterium]